MKHLSPLTFAWLAAGFNFPFRDPPGPGLRELVGRPGSTVVLAARPLPQGSDVILGATLDTFAADGEVEADGSRWVELAYSVSMVESDITLSREDFERVIENFKRYPCCPVVVEHADTDWFPKNPEWAEPHGHVEELELGEREITEMDGTKRMATTLRGRVSFDEETAPTVGAKKKWRFGSITLLKGAVDEATGAGLGAMLWSWSLTAHPRLTGLAPISASLGGGALPPDLLARLRAELVTEPPRAATAPPTPDPITEKSTMKFSLILAALGLPAAATEEEAAQRVQASAQLGVDALRALGLAPTATPAELATRAAELSTQASRVPALTQELDTFRAARAEQEKATRAAWINDLVEAQPALAPVRASLELHAERDWAGFSTTYPRPSREELTTAAAERAQRGQDAARTQPVTVHASANATTKDAPKPAAKKGDVRAAIRDVLSEFGRACDAMAVTEAIALGHTPETLRAALSA